MYEAQANRRSDRHQRFVHHTGEENLQYSATHKGDLSLSQHYGYSITAQTAQHCSHLLVWTEILVSDPGVGEEERGTQLMYSYGGEWAPILGTTFWENGHQPLAAEKLARNRAVHMNQK